MKKTLTLVAAVALGALTASAQMAAYEVETTTSSYTDITGGTVVDLQGTTGKDLSGTLIDNDGNVNFNAADDVTAFPIGFDFGYNSQTMKYFLIGGDGFILLSPDATVSTSIHSTKGSNLLSSSSAANIFGLMVRNGYYAYDDTEISYKTEGAAGSRVLTIQYKNVGVQTASYSSSQTDVAKAQIQFRLYEATGNVEMKANGFKPFDGADVGTFNFMRIGIIGDAGDRLLITSYDGSNVTTGTNSITYNAGNYPADGVTYTFVAPEPCQTPATAPTNLELTSTSTQISGTFTVGDADNYLVLATTDDALSETPVDKTKYSLNQEIGNAKVIAIVEAGEFASPQAYANQLTPGATYNVFVYGYNSKCANGPLYGGFAKGTITTKPSAPAALSASNPERTSLSLSVTSSGYYMMVAMTDQPTINSSNQILTYGVFGTPSLANGVGDEIEGGGKVVYIGDSTDGLTISDLEPGKTYFFRAWSIDANGNFSTLYADCSNVTVADLPWAFDLANAPVGEAPFGWSEEGTWSMNQRSGYFYNQVNSASEAAPVTVWRETSYIQLAQGANRVKVQIAATEIPVRFATDWTMAEGDYVAVQVTKDSEVYKDILVLNKDNMPGTDGEGNAIWNNGVFTAFSQDFTDYAGEKVRFRLIIHRQSKGQVQFKDFKIVEKPEVEAPIDVTATDVVGGTVTVVWTPQDSESKWEVSYKLADAEEWGEPIAVTETTVTLEDLVGLATYNVRVRAINAEGKKSPWSDEATFNTGIAVPFEFAPANAASESIALWKGYDGELGEATTLTEGGNGLTINDGTGWYSAKYISYMPYASLTNTWLVSPQLDLGSDATAEYTATITLRSMSDNAANPATLKIVVAKDGETFSAADVIGTITPEEMVNSSNESKEYSFTFSGYSGTIRLGYYIHGEGSDINYFYIDKIGLLDDVTTGISGAERPVTGETRYYNLNGQRVNGLQKGLLIINGRKVLVK